MTRVDFYVLSGSDPRQRQNYVCKLTEKAYRLGLTVYVRTQNDDEATALDQLLWTFRQGSFIPHERLPSVREDVNEIPVRIGTGAAPADMQGLLVNLADSLPADWARFERVAEVIDADASVKQAGRVRFLAYRAEGVEIETHTIAAE